jgi:hypothetical protein
LTKSPIHAKIIEHVLGPFFYGQKPDCSIGKCRLGGQHGNLNGGKSCADKDNIGMYGMQKSQLQHDQGQKRTS